jgi:hypothetical protein
MSPKPHHHVCYPMPDEFTPNSHMLRIPGLPNRLFRSAFTTLTHACYQPSSPVSFRDPNRVELGYNVMKGTEYFVSL